MANGCWLLAVKPLPNGYVQIKREGKIWRAHRWYYERYVGLIPSNYEVDHMCGVLACVNPTHLEAVTPTDNKRRSRATKLTLDDARAIRRSTEDRRTLALRYGIDPSNVSHIRAGRSWADAA